VSEGGLAVAVAEMAFAGGCGAEIRLDRVPREESVGPRDEAVMLFSESASRFVVEVPTSAQAAFESIFSSAKISIGRIGEVNLSNRLRFIGAQGQLIDVALADLKEAWQKPLRW
jgi:phosphoribosylformylglycinamidine synthase